MPTSSGIFAICFSIFGAGMIFVRHYAYRGTWEKYRVYHPNMMCIGLAFVLPQTYYGKRSSLCENLVIYANKFVSRPCYDHWSWYVIFTTTFKLFKPTY